MKNLRQEGWAVYVPAPQGGCVGGTLYVIGSIFGVAAYDAAEGQIVPLHNVGIYSLPKVTTEDWAVGDPIYWDASAGNCTKTAGALPQIGVATALAPAYAAAAQHPAAVGDVRLNPVFVKHPTAG